ncbi:hypothetical protein Cs7R123_48080 [Catellatospora sp. TT07R-123]|uniref:iron chaperone n=1 Tax=Catellatospora sp. TT07R-123 TaxID=2733863 RepID=UPI001B04AD39|nr:DUF1801 domain-containing protein [Catellatospora sp. TT07R-123]GHJ47466.1 hypothetical protein Cs7R123_48080 [Catellatospora sp. TT07R-123]
MTTATKKSAYDGFTAQERQAMKDHAKELKAAANRADSERDVLNKIAEMQPADRVLAERIHALVETNTPGLDPKLWYGMPAYARDGKIVCFFQSAEKFGARYATLGFNDAARLDEGAMWATGFALTAMTAETETRIADLLKTAAS